MDPQTGKWPLEGVDKPRIPDLELGRFAEALLQKAQETTNFQKALKTILDPEMKLRFLHLLDAATGANPCPSCHQVLDLLTVAQLKKHALRSVRIKWFARWFAVPTRDEFADQVAYLVFPQVASRLPGLLVTYRRKGYDSTHAFNSFNQYCRSAAVHEAGREYGRLRRGPRFCLARGPEVDVPFALDVAPCPQAEGHLQVVETLTDLERWASHPDRPVTKDAWRKFYCHRVQGIATVTVALMFQTTEGAILTNTSRVLKAMRGSKLALKPSGVAPDGITA